MRISPTKTSALYSAISDPIMDKRITIKQSADTLGKKNADDLDDMMFRLERTIWAKVKAALNIEEQ